MKKRTVVLLSLGTALILGAVVASYFTIGGDSDGVVAPNGELVITDGPSREVLPQDDDPPDALFGYNPDPQATRQFLRELPAPTIREAGPGLFQARGPPEDVFLYRALYKAHQDRFGRDYVVGRQGIGDCFVGETLVTMADGTEKPIKDVQPGDKVISRLGNSRRVTKTFAKQYVGDLVTIKSVTGNSVTATPDHLFSMSGIDLLGKRVHEWIECGKIEPNMWLQMFRGESYTPHPGHYQVEKVTRQFGYGAKYTVYCLEVERDHSFFANGFAVHNCVGWGFASGCDVHLAVMWTLGDSAEWWPSSSESVYGGSRVQARGVSNGGWSDGSYGSAAAKFLRDWGIGFRRDYGDGIDLTVYSAKRAKDWGYYGAGGQGQPSFFIDDVKKHPVRSVALVTNFDEAAAAIQSGYPIPVCSMVGFTSTRDGQGFARASGTWAHCMVFIGVRHGDRPGLLCLNSWGPTWINGPKWPDDQPDGSFWVDKATVNRMLAQRDSFVISGYDGFPFRKLDHAAWVEAKPKFWEEVLPSNESFFALAP